MFKLSNDDKSVLTLKDLRDFLNGDCVNLPDNTPIALNAVVEDSVTTNCIEVLADEENIEFYNY